jgi:hypothetical protein
MMEKWFHETERSHQMKFQEPTGFYLCILRYSEFVRNAVNRWSAFTLLHLEIPRFRFQLRLCNGGQDSVVTLVTQPQSRQPRNHGLITGRGNTFFPSPKHPEQLWGPYSLPLNEYCRLFSRGKAARGMKLITHLLLLPRLRMNEGTHPLPVCAFTAHTGTTLSLSLLYTVKAFQLKGSKNSN